MEAVREGWKLSPVTARKKLERLRTFFRFAIECGWRKGNPAASLKAPIEMTLPTLPFTKEEIEKIHWAVELFPDRGVHDLMSELVRRIFPAFQPHREQQKKYYGPISLSIQPCQSGG
jgi:hypothetical protein